MNQALIGGILSILAGSIAKNNRLRDNNQGFIRNLQGGQGEQGGNTPIGPDQPSEQVRWRADVAAGGDWQTEVNPGSGWKTSVNPAQQNDPQLVNPLQPNYSTQLPQQNSMQFAPRGMFGSNKQNSMQFVPPGAFNKQNSMQFVSPGAFNKQNNYNPEMDEMFTYRIQSLIDKIRKHHEATDKLLQRPLGQ